MCDLPSELSSAPRHRTVSLQISSAPSASAGPEKIGRRTLSYSITSQRGYRKINQKTKVVFTQLRQLKFHLTIKNHYDHMMDQQTVVQNCALEGKQKYPSSHFSDKKNYRVHTLKWPKIFVEQSKTSNYWSLGSKLTENTQKQSMADHLRFQPNLLSFCVSGTRCNNVLLANSAACPFTPKVSLTKVFNRAGPGRSYFEN